MRFVFVVLCLLMATAGSTPEAARADWSTNPQVNTPVCLDYNAQENVRSVTDGAGGMIMVWEDFRAANTHLYAQRVDADGTMLWDQNGIRVCTFDSDQESHQVVSDGAGGVYVIWVDDSGSKNIYAQRIDGSGTLLWAETGASVCNATGTQYGPHIALNIDGGFLAAWTDDRGSDHDVYVQRFNDTGTRQWTLNGVLMCDALSYQVVKGIAPDTDGGAIVVWCDYREPQIVVYARRVNHLGTPLWDANGNRVSSDTGHLQAQAWIASNENGGAYIGMFFEDSYDPGIRLPVMQHLAASGVCEWTDWGLPMHDGGGISMIGTHLTADGQGGAIMTWTEEEHPSDTVYVQRVTVSGLKLWTNDGIAMNPASTRGELVNVSNDQDGGALVVWRDMRSNEISLAAQRVTPMGDLLWDPAGVLINLGTTRSNHAPNVVPDGQGGLLVAWRDCRSTFSDDIYCQKVHNTGYLGDPSPALTEVVDFPNDQGGEVILSWNASYLDVIDHRDVVSYSVWVREDDSKGGLRAAADDTDFDGELAERLGMTPDDVQALTTSGWDFVLDLPATLASDYGCFAPTYGDSSAAGIPMADYKVFAHGGEPWLLWESNELSGYSVDNLAPGTPLALAGEMQGGGEVDLTWEASGHHDEDLNHYAIYRGAAAGFPLDPAHLVDTSIDQEYVDAPGGGEHFYRVTAIDAHGNESNGSNEILVTDQNAVPDATPLAFALHPNHPNPFNPSTIIRFDLSIASTAVLRVYDVAGLLVRTLVADAALSPGRHTVTWNGLDDGGMPVAAGVYFYQLIAGDFAETRRMVLIQ